MDGSMHIKRVLLVLFLLMMVLSSAVVGYAQSDSDGDLIPDTLDRCPLQAGPRENGGCPVGQPGADRDGDGVLDFADFCPDQAASGFTQGCPPGVATPTASGVIIPNITPIIWDTLDGCVVGNNGMENINIRSFVPDPNTPMQPVIVGVLPPGAQFMPIYAQTDVNNVVWYAGMSPQLNIPADMIGWVSGAVAVTNGQCDNLLEQPTNAPAESGNPWDSLTECLVGVTANGATIYDAPSYNASVIGNLAPATQFTPTMYEIQENARWYAAEGAEIGLPDGVTGWVNDDDTVTNNKCAGLPEQNFPWTLEPGMEICLFGVSRAHVGSVPVHADADPASAVIGQLSAGAQFQPWLRDYDANGGLWLLGAIGPNNSAGWVSGDNVFSNGNCVYLPQVIHWEAPDDTPVVVFPNFAIAPDYDWRSGGGWDVTNFAELPSPLLVDFGDDAPDGGVTPTPVPDGQGGDESKSGFEMMIGDEPVDLGDGSIIVVMRNLGLPLINEAYLILPELGDEPGQCPPAPFFEALGAAFPSAIDPVEGLDENSLIGLLLPAVQQIGSLDADAARTVVTPYAEIGGIFADPPDPDASDPRGLPSQCAIKLLVPIGESSDGGTIVRVFVIHLPDPLARNL